MFRSISINAKVPFGQLNLRDRAIFIIYVCTYILRVANRFILNVRALVDMPSLVNAFAFARRRLNFSALRKSRLDAREREKMTGPLGRTIKFSSGLLRVSARAIVISPSHQGKPRYLGRLCTGSRTSRSLSLFFERETHLDETDLRLASSCPLLAAPL